MMFSNNGLCLVVFLISLAALFQDRIVESIKSGLLRGLDWWEQEVERDLKEILEGARAGNQDCIEAWQRYQRGMKSSE